MAVDPRSPLPQRILVGRMVTVAASVAIALLTLLPQQQFPSLEPATVEPTDLLQNLILFIPLGIGLALQGRSIGFVALAGGLGSIGIELAQISLISGRDSSVHDVVSNLLGAIIGAWLVHHWNRRRVWWRLVGAMLAGVVLLYATIGGGMALPAPPIDTPLYSQWQHDFPGMRRFPGRILSLSLQGVDLPDGTIPNPGELVERISRADTTSLHLLLETGTPGDSRTQLAGIVMGWPGPHLVNVIQEGRSILVRSRLRMSMLGFRSPVVEVPEVIPARPGDTLRIEVWITRRSVRVAVRDDGSVRSSELRLSADLALAAISPADLLFSRNRGDWWIRVGATLGAFLLVGLGIPRRTGLQVAGLVAWVIAGPLLFGLSPLPAYVVAAGVAGLVAGTWLGQVMRLA